MMFRALPFWGKTQDETLEQTRRGEAEIPELNDERWRAVVSLVLRMMSKEAQDRPSALACFKELTELEPLVTKSGKSRALRIAEAALVHYGYVDAAEDCSLEEFCESAAPEVEDASPPVAAPKASLLSGVGRMLTAAKAAVHAPRVRQMVSKAFRRSAHASEVVSKVSGPENESQSCDGHCLAEAYGLMLGGDAEGAEVTGVVPKATDTLPGLVVSNAEPAKNQGEQDDRDAAECGSTIVAESEKDEKQRGRATSSSIVLDFPGKAAEDLDLLLEEDDLDGASSVLPPTDGAKLPHPPTDQDEASWQSHSAPPPCDCPEVLSGHQQCDLRRFNKHVSESPDESQEEGDAFEFAPVVSDELE
ncbi:PEPKR2 [Symbiodinium sp. CCMP2592]|nr:PEPKR2 [Symbiodinium sp. CCMP2592]